MATTPQYMVKVAGWEQTIAAYLANPDDVKRMEPERARLEQIANHFKVLLNERAALEASKQDTTKEMQALFREAETLADALRTFVRNFYGLDSEKLVEFGIRPSRPRARRIKPPVEPQKASEPSATASNEN